MTPSSSATRFSSGTSDAAPRRRRTSRGSTQRGISLPQNASRVRSSTARWSEGSSRRSVITIARMAARTTRPHGFCPRSRGCLAAEAPDVGRYGATWTTPGRVRDAGQARGDPWPGQSTGSAAARASAPRRRAASASASRSSTPRCGSSAPAAPSASRTGRWPRPPRCRSARRRTTSPTATTCCCRRWGTRARPSRTAWSRSSRRSRARSTWTGRSRSSRRCSSTRPRPTRCTTWRCSRCSWRRRAASRCAR